MIFLSSFTVRRWPPEKAALEGDTLQDWTQHGAVD